MVQEQEKTKQKVMETKNPLLKPKQKNRYISLTSAKLSVLILLSVVLLGFTGCKTNNIKLPTFFEKEYKRSDIIQIASLKEAVTLLSKNKISSLSYKITVDQFESRFYDQITLVKNLDSEFFLELENKMRTIYISASPVSAGETIYLKLTMYRIYTYMIEHMSLPVLSDLLRNYAVSLDYNQKDYESDYVLDIADLIVGGLKSIDSSITSIEDMKVIKSNILETGKPFRKKAVRASLRYATKSLEEIVFLIEERLLEVERYRKSIQDFRKVFVGDDSSFKLIQTLRELREVRWIDSVDYPYLLGNGYVEVLPTEIYNVVQYGRNTLKRYIFKESVVDYKSTQDFWVSGSYKVSDSLLTMKVGRYETESELFQLTKSTYLMGSEVLILE
jgi:hypothetical protein